MLKGINRRIIEINRTNNDYFEKAILFVKTDKSGCSQQLLSDQADLFLMELPKNDIKKDSRLKIILTAGIALSSCAIIVATLYAVLY